MNNPSDGSAIHDHKTAVGGIPLIVPFAETRIAHPIKIGFDAPEAASDAAVAASFANPVVDFPSHVRVINLGMVLTACAMLLVGGLFMPGGQFSTSWWHTSAGFSGTSIVPTLLNHWQLAVGVVGILVIPFLKTQHRGRLALSLGLSLSALLVVSLLEQQIVGVPLILLPFCGLAAMVTLNAVLRARTLAPDVRYLKHWQIFTGLASITLWLLPAYESIHGTVMRQILIASGGSYLTSAFIFASIAGVMAGVLGMVDGGDGYSPARNVTARFLSSAAIVVMGGCGLVLAAHIGHVSAVEHASTRWFGVGLVWLDLVINACILMAWSGLIERFGGVAAHRHGLPEHGTD